MHHIRLRGPWEYEPVTGASAVSEFPPPGRVHLSSPTGHLPEADFRGRVRFRRRFGQPTNLQSGQRVWLVLDGVNPAVVAMLNDRALEQIAGGDPQVRFDVTDCLQIRNELTIELPWQDGPPGDVRLEIEE